MGQEGRLVSSVISNININFRTSENDQNILKALKDFQKTAQNQTVETKEISQKIFNENGAPFIQIKSNLNERPLKLLIDTGAAITILASDLVSKDVNRINYIVNLYGIVGKDVSIKTEGIVSGSINMNDQHLGAIMHLVDRKFSGPADGYLGYDFLSSYGVLVDMKEMLIKIVLIKGEQESEKQNEIICHCDKLEEEKEVNFLQILAQTYEFSEENENKKEKNIKNNEFEKYIEAMNYYEKEIEKIEERKVNSGICKEKHSGSVFSHNIGKQYNLSKNEAEHLADDCFHNSLEYKQLIFQDIRSEMIYKKLNLEGLSESEKETIKNICIEFPFQFYLDGDKLGSTEIIKHEIHLIPNNKIVNIRQYRIPQAHRKILHDIVADHEKQGIIERCQSPWNSPAILVKKKDEFGGMSDFRFVVDYRKLNEITEIQNFPIPLIDDILNGLSGSVYYTTLDIKNAFHQILVDEKSRDYTAFSTGKFQYRWVRMPFGLSAAPLTWQKAINLILFDLLGEGVYVYLDDVIIYAKTKDEHDNLLRKVLACLKEHNLQLKISKCLFFAKKFEYLGHIISNEGIKANPKKIEVIKEYPRPNKVKDIQSFLGLCNYFRRYVRNFAKISKPLTSLLKKEMPFVWTNYQQEAFDKLKQALIDEVVLQFPNFNELFYVTTDASNVAIGAMLSQGDLPNDRPISFFSKVLNEAQKRYSTIQKELLAIVEAIKAFKVYLYGRYFVLITDHKALCYLFNMKDCNSRLFRQKLDLMDYNFKILYRPGAQNHVADALSRLEPLSIEEVIEIDKGKECHAVTRAQRNKEIISKTKKLIIEEKDGTILRKNNYDMIFHLIPIETNTLRNNISDKFGIVKFDSNFRKIQNSQYYRLISNQFSSERNKNETMKCINEILEICENEKSKRIAINIDFDNLRHYMYFKNAFEEVFSSHNMEITFYLNKIVELKEREDIEEIMRLYHTNLLGGHFGAQKMTATISKYFTWTNMYNDIKEYVKNCPICEKTKVTTHTKIPMQISSLGEVLYDHTYIDFVGPIQQSGAGNKYIFTALCDLTRHLTAVATTDCTAITAAQCLLEHIICRYNFPSRLISDNATSFTSQVIKELTNLFHIKKIFVCPYKPSGNLVERSHRMLNSYLRSFTTKNRDDWDDLLKYATFAYNNAIHSSTGFTPHELAHGFKIKIPTNLTKPKLTYNYENFADMTRNNIARALELAKENLYNSKEKNKKYYDRNVRDIDININDLVLVKSHVKKHKFQDVYDGPFTVVKVEDAYLEILRDGKRQKVHKNHVKKARADYENSILTYFLG